MTHHKRFWMTALLLAAPQPFLVHAADHGDTPMLIGAARHDARLTDLHSFVRNGRLVLSVCLDPTIPADVHQYHFASDLVVRIHIDNDSAVTFDDPVALATFGGTIVSPGAIQEDIVFEVSFTPAGQPQLSITGLAPGAEAGVSMFTGLRDDPFIRGPVIGRNVASIVLELPLADVLAGQSTLLIWATSQAEDLGGPFHELTGRALRSQLGPNNDMNTLHPADHFNMLGLVPDVMIFNTANPASFPNGRALPDDVVDLVGVPGVLATDAPFPSENDVPYLPAFPYLAPPHLLFPPVVPAVSRWGVGLLAAGLIAGLGLWIRRTRRAAC